MGNLIHERVGGQTVHVGDCRIWAEIFYLDSSTDYRECLSHKNDLRLINSGEDLIMLDDVNFRSNIKAFFSGLRRQFLKISR